MPGCSICCSICCERFAYRLIVLRAGAGFGKSTLVRQALAANVAEPAGIDISRECTADDVHVSELGARLRALLGVSHGPLATASADAQALADAIAPRSPLDVCVIIEDAHLLRAAPSWDLVKALLDRLPPNGHLLLSTRHDTDLPVARLASPRLGPAAGRVGPGLHRGRVRRVRPQPGPRSHRRP